MLYMVTFTINIPQMLAYIPAPWILWVLIYFLKFNLRGLPCVSKKSTSAGHSDEGVGPERPDLPGLHVEVF